VIGLLLIAYAVFVFNGLTPVPSFYSLIPTVGTVLVILCATEGTIVGRFLGSKPLVGIGLISYSAYLWHQPVFAFVRQRSIDPPGDVSLGGAAVCTLLLAYLSWKYVEKPFRNKMLVTRNTICYFGSVCSCSFIFIGLAGDFYNGYAAARMNAQQVHLSATAIPSPKRNECHTGGRDYKKPSEA
jgi:peptidoglycan/LPS O-acetylase OafA/YrhL